MIILYEIYIWLMKRLDKQVYKVVPLVVIIGLVVIIIPLETVSDFYPVNAQFLKTEADAATPSQTAASNTTVSSNSTRGDLDPILNNLFAAREELSQGDSPSAFDSLNVASSQLFNLTTRLAANDDGKSQELVPLQKRIEWARNNLLRNNFTAALLNLNAADSEFVKLTIKLQ